MKALLLTLSMIFAAQSFAIDTSPVSCKLTQESLDKIDEKEMDSQTGGIWFLEIPYDFDLEISEAQMLMKFNYSDSIGVRGYPGKVRNDDFVIKFANYKESDHPWNNRYGSDTKASLQIKKDIVYGKYSYKGLSPITYSGDPVLHKYIITYDQVNMRGTLQTSNNILIKKITKYELDFTCN